MPPLCSYRRDHRTVIRGMMVATALWALAPAVAAPRPAGLDAEVRATWTRVPLREWADHASNLGSIPVIIDRRLDPDRTVTITADGDTLRSILDSVAESAGGVVEPLASTVRIVPRSLFGQATAAEAARDAAVLRLPASVKRRVERRAAWAWRAGATPRDLVGELVSEADVPLVGIERIPHDHWPAGSFSALSLAERLDLVLAHFDLRVDWTPEGGTIVPIHDGVGPVADAPPRGRATAAGPRPTRRTTGKDVYTLRLEAPLDVALASVAARLGLEVSLDRASLAAKGIAAGEIIRVEVRDLARDELLDALVDPLGLSWSVDGATLRVFAASTDTGSGRAP